MWRGSRHDAVRGKDPKAGLRRRSQGRIEGIRAGRVSLMAAVWVGMWVGGAGRAGGEPLLKESGPATDTTAVRWVVGVSFGREVMEGRRPGWPDGSEQRGWVQGRGRGGAVGMELFRVVRFHQTDAGVVLEGYRDLWRGGYGHLRLRVTPQAEVLPRYDVRGEVFQGVGEGWEMAASGWRMELPGPNVTVLGVGVGRYLADWYVRALTHLGRLAGKGTVSFSGRARRYLGASQEYWEVVAGVGEEPAVLGPGPSVAVRRTRFFAAGFQRFPSAWWGLSLHGSYQSIEGTPARWIWQLGGLARF